MKRFLLAIVLTVLAGCAVAPDHRAAARDLSATVVTLQGEDGRVFCSGVAYSETQVFTAKHCVEDGGLSTVRTFDGKTLDATVTYQSPNFDFAVIEVAPGALKPAKFGKSADVAAGDAVVAIGHPFGYEWTVTFGFVSKVAIPTTFDSGEYIGHTAQLNPGNSGGPLFNADGEVVGLNIWIIRGSGLAFSLAIDQALAEVATK